MNDKKLRKTAVVSLVLTALWLVFMIATMLQSGPVSSFAEAVTLNIDLLFILTYINATLVTVTVTAFFVCLYKRCKILNAKFSLAGMLFVPTYAALNLFVYLSQITVVPYLSFVIKQAVDPTPHQRIMAQFVQSWPDSAIAMFNQLAYAVLGIPSIIYGCLLLKANSRLGGVLLILNGIACIIGMVGTIADNDLLAAGSVAGGALFLAALAAILVEAKAGHIFKEGV